MPVIARHAIIHYQTLPIPTNGGIILMMEEAVVTAKAIVEIVKTV